MSRYAQTYQTPKGPGDARPTAMQIVEDEGLLGKLTDKIMVVTGVSSGIGVETMRALYATGAHVFGTARDLMKATQVIQQIESTTKGGKLTLIEMHMDSLESVRKGAEDILKLTNEVNILINNAGVMATPEGKTKDGFETQFGTNHIGHFYLFQLLKDALLAAATPEFPSRVVSVASTGHRAGGVRFGDYNFEKEPYDAWAAYGQSKTANIYFATELDRRYSSRNLHATSLMPGGIDTGLGKHTDITASEDFASDEAVAAYMSSPAQGAATSVYAALSSEWSNAGGKYLAKCVEQNSVPDGTTLYDISSDGFVSHAYNEGNEKRLWVESLKMLGMEDDQ